MHHGRAELREANEEGQLLEVRVVLGPQRVPGEEVRRRQLLGPALALLQVFLFVVAQDALVLHGELHALAWFGAAIDEIAREDHAVGRGDLERVQQLDGFVEAAVQISDDEGAIHGGGDGITRPS